MNLKRVVLILCVCAVLSISAVHLSIVAEADPNLSIEAKKTAYAVGDTFEVTLVTKEISVISIACGISFDAEKLECISITGADIENPAKIRLKKTGNAPVWFDAYAYPTIEESNASGNVGVTFAATAEQTFAAGEIFTVVFRAKATGESNIAVFENSDGKDGRESDNEILKTIFVYDKSEAEKANVYLSADKNTLAVGEQIRVTLFSREMRVATFITGISFDKSKLKCISIVGSDPDYPSAVGITKKGVKDGFTSATVVHTTEEANATGNVGITVLSVADADYVAGAVFSVTFEAIAEGEALISLFEDSDGTDTYRADGIVIKSVNITKVPNVGVKSKGIPEYDPLNKVGYSVEGRAVTVKYPTACRAGYLDNNEYVKLEAKKNADGSYTFTAPKDVKEVLLVVLGDLNCDGRVDSTDTSILAEGIRYDTLKSPELILAADINLNEKINSADRVWLARSLLDESHELYKELEW